MHSTLYATARLFTRVDQAKPVGVCNLLQPAYARMQAAAGITWMHTVAF